MSKIIIMQNTINQLATLPIDKQHEFLNKEGLNPTSIETKKTKSGIMYFVEKNN